MTKLFWISVAAALEFGEVGISFGSRGTYSAPAFLNGDIAVGWASGDVDMYVSSGSNYVFTQTLWTAAPPAAFPDNDPSRAAPFWMDDELLVGTQGGHVLFLRRAGSQFVESNQGGSLLLYNVGDNSAPSCANFPERGCVVGEENGNLNYFRANGDLYTLADFSLLGVSSNAMPSCLDVDGDGDADCFVGDITGKVRYFRNDQRFDSPVFTFVDDDCFGAQGSYAAPACRIDEFDEIDCLLGDADGSIRRFRAPRPSASTSKKSSKSSSGLAGIDLALILCIVVLAVVAAVLAYDLARMHRRIDKIDRHINTPDLDVCGSSEKDTGVVRRKGASQQPVDEHDSPSGTKVVV